MKRYFAEINENGEVLRVIVADQEFIDSGAVGNPANWVETYKDRSKRKNYAGKGCKYDTNRDAFIPPKPYESWELDEKTCNWKAPVDRPPLEELQNDEVYEWKEDVINWVKNKRK